MCRFRRPMPVSTPESGTWKTRSPSRSEMVSSRVLPSMLSPAGPCIETSTEDLVGLVMAAWTIPPTSSTAVRMRRMAVSGFRWLQGGGVEDVERALEPAAAEEVARRCITREVVERVPVERRLGQPVGASDGGQLGGVDAGGQGPLPPGDRGPVVQAPANAGGAGAAVVPGVDVQRAPGRIRQVDRGPAGLGHRHRRVARGLDDV